MLTDRDWLAAFAAALGAPVPAADEFGRVLTLAAGRAPEKAGAIAQGLGAGSAA